MLGTIVNSLAIIGGCLIGLIVKGRLTEKISSTIMNGLALCVLYIGISGALKGKDTLQIIICIALGALIGEVIDIDRRLNDLGNMIERKINGKRKIILTIKYPYQKDLLHLAYYFVLEQWQWWGLLKVGYKEITQPFLLNQY